MTNMVRVSEERYFSAHHKLLLAARNALGRGKRKQHGWIGELLTVMVLSGLAVEGVTNAIWSRIDPQWMAIERKPPFQKVRLLCEKLCIPFDKALEPWRSVRWLLDFRDAAAHPQPQKVQTSRTITAEEHELEQQGNGDWFPASDFEKELTVENAERAIAAIDALIETLCTRLPSAVAIGIEREFWTGSATLVE